MKNYEFFNANQNWLKCAFLHTLMVKTEGGLTFFGQYIYISRQKKVVRYIFLLLKKTYFLYITVTQLSIIIKFDMIFINEKKWKSGWSVNLPTLLLSKKEEVIYNLLFLIKFDHHGVHIGTAFNVSCWIYTQSVMLIFTIILLSFLVFTIYITQYVFE